MRGLVFLQHAHVRIEPRRERVLLQDAPAEPVDGRDAHPRGRLRMGSGEPLAHALGQLAGRALREGDDDEPVGIDAVLDRPRNALDEHARLAAAGAGGDEHEPARLDRALLLVGERAYRAHARALRQMTCCSHQAGQRPGSGSCRTSPARIRRTAVRATSAARSTSASKVSSST